MHIAIIGYSGSGKSTLANEIGSFTKIPVFHIDSVRWHAGWNQRSNDEIKSIIAKFMEEHDDWIIEGTYLRFKFHERLENADEIIILELPRITCFLRACKRYRKYKGLSDPIWHLDV